MTAPCTSVTCPRRETCNRHAPGGRYGTDYSHGPWFEPDHCFWWQPGCVDTRPSERVASLYAGGWP